MMTTNFFEVFNSVLKRAPNLPIAACVQTNQVTTFIFRRKAIAACLSEEAFIYRKYPLSSLPSVYRRIVIVLECSTFTRGIMEVKAGQSSVHPNKQCYIQLVELQNRTCICQNPNLLGYYCSHILMACQACILTQTIRVVMVLNNNIYLYMGAYLLAHS